MCEQYARAKFEDLLEISKEKLRSIIKRTNIDLPYQIEFAADIINDINNALNDQSNHENSDNEGVSI